MGPSPSSPNSRCLASSPNSSSRPTTLSECSPVRKHRLQSRRMYLSKFHVPIILLFTLLALFTTPSKAVLITTFRNCLPWQVATSPSHLQFHPLAVNARLEDGSAHRLNITVYGNVTGSSSGNPAGTKRWLIEPDEGLVGHAGNSAWLSGRSRILGRNVEERDLEEEGGYYRLDRRQDPPLLTTGEIVNQDPTWAGNKRTTLRSTVNVLNYELLNRFTGFCDHADDKCPMKVSNATKEEILANPDILPSFFVTTGLGDSYAFTSVIATFRIISGDAASTHIGCIKVEITPPLGDKISNAIRFTPLGILLFVGMATVLAAIFNPWNGTKDVFRWSTNYGMDDDMLRLVTPGFGDCLQYIQFVILTGSLSLSYPGFFQPVVSKGAWSILLFNNTLISETGSISRLVDGVYSADAEYGLERMSELVGIGEAQDIWPVGMAYLAGIVAIVVVLVQLGFLIRWVFMKANSMQEEDLRSKNLPFTVGNIIRIFYNYLLNPFVALTTFQFIVNKRSPDLSTGLAGTFISLFVLATIFILYRVATYKPKSALTDDLSPLLLYGSLYNTYKLDSISFCMIQVIINIVRAMAFGALQPSGIAQLTVLAVCEVILILTLNAVRPFSSKTSMNLYQTFFSAIRLLTVLFSVTFIPELNIDDAAKGWVGYAVLLMHGIVLVFGFFLNALQTLVEIVARLLGAGNDGGTAARGGLAQVFGKRQLSRRRDRHEATHSQYNHRATNSSGAPSLMTGGGGEGERRSTINSLNKQAGIQAQAHSRSGSSAILLGRSGDAGVGTPSDNPGMIRLLDTPSGGRGHRHTGSVSTTAYTPTSPIQPNYSGGMGAGGGGGGGAILGLGVLAAASSDSGPYYRAPRMRSNSGMMGTTGDSPTAAKSRGSWGSSDWGPKFDATGNPITPSTKGGPIFGPGVLGSSQASLSGGVRGPTDEQGTGTPPPFANRGQVLSDNSLTGSGRAQTDYAVREMDFYYGVRGPALSSNAPSRRLGTGPADPTGPMAVAKGWILSKLGRSKEKGKGFEVVRSARAPEIRREMEEAAEAARRQQEERQSAVATATSGDDDSSSSGEENENLAGRKEGKRKASTASSDSDSSSDEEDEYPAGPSAQPSTLPTIDIGGELGPARKFSKKTAALQQEDAPTVPRKSSKRKSASLLLKPSPLPSESGSPSLAAAQLMSTPEQISRGHELYDPPLPPLKTHSRQVSLPYELSPEQQGAQSPHHPHQYQQISQLPSQHHTHHTQQYHNLHNQAQHQNLSPASSHSPSSPSSRLPFSSPSLAPSSPTASRNSSTTSSILPPPPGVPNPNVDGPGSRPASVGTVTRHRIEDSLTTGPDERMLGRESMGELGMVEERDRENRRSWASLSRSRVSVGSRGSRTSRGPGGGNGNGVEGNYI